MSRPIDIRDIPPRDAVLGDKRLGLDSNDELAMTNQPDNSAIGTAASRNIGTAEDQIPLNSDLPASAKSGDYNDLTNLPALGTAAAKNTGLNTGDVLTPEGAGLDNGETNWTSGNLLNLAPELISVDSFNYTFPSGGTYDYWVSALDNNYNAINDGESGRVAGGTTIFPSGMAQTEYIRGWYKKVAL